MKKNIESMIQAAKRKPIPVKRKLPRRSARVLDPKYLDWLRSMPCWACEKTHYDELSKPIRYEEWAKMKLPEAAHIGLSTSLRGLGQKFSDKEAIPLCRGHHRDSPGSIHSIGVVGFFARFGTDRDTVIKLFNKLYEDR